MRRSFGNNINHWNSASSNADRAGYIGHQGWMWGGSDDQESTRTIHQALDSGITTLDTAPAYGQGHSETIVGEAIKTYGHRQNITLATKVCLGWFGTDVFRNGQRNG